jgi:hypothetical protein
MRVSERRKGPLHLRNTSLFMCGYELICVLFYVYMCDESLLVVLIILLILHTLSSCNIFNLRFLQHL